MSFLISKIKKIPAIMQNEGMSGVVNRLQIRLFGDQYQKDFQNSYTHWYELHKPTEKQVALEFEKQKSFKIRPLISIITPVFNPSSAFLSECITSVVNQSYPNWELILIDDASTNARIWPILEGFSKADKRIRIVHREKNGHICKASNDGLAIAKGDWIALLDNDDVLWSNALYEVVRKINEKPKTKFIYSDEDKLSENGVTHCDPFFKPDWSPHFMWSCNYITHFAVIKKNIVDAVHGFTENTQGAQDWDLFLKVIEHIHGYNEHPWSNNCSIQHIDRVLYSWRKSKTSTASQKHAFSAKQYAYNVQASVIERALQAQGGGSVQPSKYIGLYQTFPKINGNETVSIIIPTKNNLDYLMPCLESIQKSNYAHFDIHLVDTGSDTETLAYYHSLDKRVLTIHNWRKEFNYSAVCNYAVQKSKGEYLLFLNDDTVINSPDWIEKMLSYATRKEVGAVGARLLYKDGSIQHNGLILGKETAQVLNEKGFVSNYFRTRSTQKNYGIPSLYLENIRDYSAVTAACLLISREKHNSINGFDESLRIAFNDVSYCLSLQEKKLFNILIPDLNITHAESVSLGKPSEPKRDLTLFAQEIRQMRNKWGDKLNRDVFLNKNLTLKEGMLFCSR